MNESNDNKNKGFAYKLGFYGFATVIICGLMALVALTIKFVSWLLF